MKKEKKTKNVTEKAKLQWRKRSQSVLHPPVLHDWLQRICEFARVSLRPSEVHPKEPG